MSVPGIPTPMAFFRILALSSTCIFFVDAGLVSLQPWLRRYGNRLSTAYCWNYFPIDQGDYAFSLRLVNHDYLLFFIIFQTCFKEVDIFLNVFVV